ncbi:MAG: N-acetylmuramoyl-L-alanine amidase [Rhodospirillales bacterium]|nr:N-acetylmuramoyl-L-alanine amidase [Rhodospirillales bacterium]
MRKSSLFRRAWALALAAGSAALPAAACPPQGPLVALDAGHSPASPGATSARGRPEYGFNIALARRVQTALAGAGFRTVLVNAEARAMKPAERAYAAQRAGADLLVSLHHDSVQPRYLDRWTHEGRSLAYSDRFAGYSLFVSARNGAAEGSARLGWLLGGELTARGLTPTLHHAEAIPGENRPLLEPRLGLYRFDDLLVLKSAPMPAVLVEAGVIVHRAEEERLAAPARQDQVAEAIVAAVQRYCGPK